VAFQRRALQAKAGKAGGNEIRGMFTDNEACSQTISKSSAPAGFITSTTWFPGGPFLGGSSVAARVVIGAGAPHSLSVKISFQILRDSQGYF
jgi:hypothetical protein